MAESSKKNKKGNRHSHNRPDEKIRLPKGEELFGIVDTRLGMGKSRIRCSDGKERICRVPGALKRRLWVRPNNIVILKINQTILLLKSAHKTIDIKSEIKINMPPIVGVPTLVKR